MNMFTITLLLYTALCLITSIYYLFFKQDKIINKKVTIYSSLKQCVLVSMIISMTQLRVFTEEIFCDNKIVLYYQVYNFFKIYAILSFVIILTRVKYSKFLVYLSFCTMVYQYITNVNLIKYKELIESISSATLNPYFYGDIIGYVFSFIGVIITLLSFVLLIYYNKECAKKYS